jgi:hypothetical protein
VAQFAVRRVLASANSCCPRVGDKGYDPCAANWPTPCCNATYGRGTPQAGQRWYIDQSYQIVTQQ